MKTKKKKEQLIVLTDVITVLADRTENHGKYAVFEERVPPLGGPPPHMHPDEEVFYIIEGEFEFVLHDLTNTFRTLPGSVVHVPSNALHAFKNTGHEPGLMVVMLSPGNLVDYFREIGTRAESDEEIPDLSQIPVFEKLDVGKAFEHAPKHHVNFVLPEISREPFK